MQQLNEATRAKVNADQVDNALAVARAELIEQRRMPSLDPDCRVQERSGAVVGDGFDVIAMKSDKALTAANARIDRCFRNQDANRVAREPR